MMHQCNSCRMSRCLKAGFHTCVSITHNGTRCLLIYGHQYSQAIPVFATKPCVLTTKSHMLNFCKGLRSLCRDMQWLWPMGTDNTGKKAREQTKNITTTFGKLLFLTQYRMRYSIYIPPNTKDLAISLTRLPMGTGRMQ